MKPDLINKFPRAMGNPHQNFIAFTKEQRDQYIQKYIKMCDLYMSVYQFSEIDEEGEPVRESAIVDKIFLDFDSDNWLQDLKKVHCWCRERNLLHRCHFSGRGAHLFIFVVPNVVNKKQAVGNFQRWITQQLEIEIDKKIVGDIARIFRYPNTFNFKARRFCIPLNPADLDNGKPEEYFMKLSTQQQFCNAWTGSRLLNLKEFDNTDYLFMDYSSEDVEINEVDPNISTEYPEFPPCVQSWLSTPKLNGKGKFLLILFLKDQTFTPFSFEPLEIASILKKTLDPAEYDHYFKGKYFRGHQGHNGLKFKSILRKDYYMPNCDEIQKMGYCPKDCGRRNPIYK